MAGRGSVDASLAAGTTMYIENASRHHIIDAAPPDRQSCRN